MNVYVKVFITQKAKDGYKNKCKYFQMSEFSGYIGQKPNEKSERVRGNRDKFENQSRYIVYVYAHMRSCRIFLAKFFGEIFF